MKKLPKKITLECNVVRGKEGWSLTVIDSGQEFFVPAPPKNGHINDAALNAVIEHIESLSKQGAQADFLEELIEERTETSPEFPVLVEQAAAYDPFKRTESETITEADAAFLRGNTPTDFELNTTDMSDLVAAAGAKRPTIAPPPPLSAHDHPNSYTVDLNIETGKVMALWSKAQEPEKYDVVRPVGTSRFTVLVRAANSKHAGVLGEHLIRKHMKRG